MAINSNIPDSMRNKPCPCGSELKAKHCHADPIKLQVCSQIAKLYMMKLIVEERKKRGLEPYLFTCKKCGKGTDQPRKSEIAGNVLLCPDKNCNGTVKQNEKPKEDSQENSIIF